MHWKTELENRIANSLFTKSGLVRLDQVAIRHFNTALLPDTGWRFDKGCGKGWSEAFKSKAHARGELSMYLTDEEDMLVRALTGVAEFTHAPWLKPHRSRAPYPGNEGLEVGHYRMCGDHVHTIRFHDGFICAAAVKINRIERISLPAIPEALKSSDRFMILKVESDSMVQTIVLNPNDPVHIFPATVEDDDVFGVTAKSIREAIALFDSMDHMDQDSED